MALTDNILAYWKLDNDGSGGVSLVDSTGNGNTLTNNNGVSLGTGIIGGDAVFNGNNYLTGGITSAVVDDFSVSFWINPNETINQYPICFSSSDVQDFSIYARETALPNGLRISVNDVSFTQDDIIYTGNWYHISLSRSLGVFSIYLNGVFIGTLDESTQIDLTSLYIANSNYVVPTTFNGQIDEIAVWNRALTANEVTALYNGGAGVSYPFLVFYFNADVDGNLAELGNWWQDSGFTTPATSLPTSIDIVSILAPVTSGTETYSTAIINSNIGSAVTITASSISVVGGINSGILVGNVTLYNTASNSGTITGNATLRDSSTNSGTITGNANVYYDNGNGTKPIGGIVGGDITYIGWPITKAWFSSSASGTNDENFANPANWWLDAGLTIPANKVPSVVTDIVVVGAMSAISTGTAVVNSVAVLNGGSINSIEVTATNGIHIVGGSSSGATFYTSGGSVGGNAGGFISRLLKLPWFINI